MLYSPLCCVLGQCRSASVILSLCHTLFSFPLQSAQHISHAAGMKTQRQRGERKGKGGSLTYRPSFPANLSVKNARSQLRLCCWVNWRHSPVQIHTAQHDNEELCRSSPAAWLAHSQHFACYPPTLNFCDSWKASLISFSGKHKQAPLKTPRWPFARDWSR